MTAATGLQLQLQVRRAGAVVACGSGGGGGSGGSDNGRLLSVLCGHTGNLRIHIGCLRCGCLRLLGQMVLSLGS